MENYVPRRNKKLIVTADDFGLAPGINKAVVRAYRDGIVTSASLMANGSAFESAVILARENPGLDIGLHLNLTDDPIAFAVRSISGQMRDIDLELRIRAQLEKALNAGVRLTHLDGHKHVHAVPQVLRVVARLAPEYGIRAIRRVVERSPALRAILKRTGRERRGMVKQYLFARVVSGVWTLSESGVSKSAFVFPNRFYGVTQTGFLDFSSLRDVIRDLGSGVNELMCHPGFIDHNLKNTPTRLLTQREQELELLTQREVRDLINQSGVDLISYRNLVEDYGSCDPDAVLGRYSGL
jgi:predicted glycoside hydrolase/deacetylase ChbG (UPF0249 family)